MVEKSSITVVLKVVKDSVSDFGFPRALRLLDKTAIQHVFKTGRKLRLPEISIFFVPNTLQHPRFCPSVSKKFIPKAHDRNQIKRIFRESFRLHQHLLTSWDIIIAAYKPINQLNKKQIREIMDPQWQKLCQLQQPSVNTR